MTTKVIPDVLVDGAVPADVLKLASDPTGSTNKPVGQVALNTTSGEMYICTDATTDANVWTNVGDGTGVQPYIGMVATGGVITTDGNFKVHTFNSSSNFVVTTLGSDAVVEYLTIAGGASGGGRDGTGKGAGGGAGGYRTAAGFGVEQT